MKQSLRIWLFGDAAFGLGTLTFIGTILEYPRQILQGTEGLTTPWISSLVILFALGSFFLLAFFRRTHGLQILAGGALGTTIMSIVLVNRFFASTKDVLEPWLIQSAWFLRGQGVVVGLFLGFLLFSTTTALALFIDQNTIGKNFPVQRTEWRVGLLVGGCIGIFGILQYLFRYFSLGYGLITILVFGAIFTSGAVSASFGSTKSINASLSDVPIGEDGCDIPVRTRFYRRTQSPKDDDEKVPTIFRRFDRVNEHLRRAGTEPLGFWWLAVLLGLGSIAWAYALTQPSGDGREHYLDILVLFLIVGFVAVVGQSQRRADCNFYEHGLGHGTVFFFRIFNILRAVIVLVLVGAVLYNFPYLLYLPDVLVSMTPFLLGGAFLAILAKKSRNANLLTYGVLIALAMLGLHLGLLFWDISQNAFNYYGGHFDTIFPFTYLHSLPQLFLVGVAVGILLTAEFYRLGFQYSDGGDATNRALFVTLGAIIVGIMIVLLGEWFPVPGGGIAWNTRPTIQLDWGDEFFLYSAIGLILVISAVVMVALTNFLPQLFIRKGWRKVKTPDEIIGEKQNRELNVTRISRNRTGDQERGSHAYNSRRQVIALGLITMVLAGTIGGVVTGMSVKIYRGRPVIVYETGSHAFWIQQSSERVAKQSIVDLDPTNRVSEWDVYLARNEYESFQVVVRPLGTTINALSARLSDFQHTHIAGAKITKGNHTVQMVDYVMDDAFPDVLKPFDVVTLTERQNYAFWVTLKVPYEALEGTYKGTVTFYFNQRESVTLTINLHVWNFAVPQERHLRTNMGGQTADPELINTYDTHRINTYGIPIQNASKVAELAQGWPYTCHHNWTTGAWEFNWDGWDTRTGDLIARGFNGFVVGWGPLGMGRVWPINNPTWVASCKWFFGNLTTHLETKGWLPYAYIYFIDEFQMFIPEGFTRAGYFAELEIYLQILEEATGGKLEIMTTTPPSHELAHLDKYFDIYCPISTDRNKTEWDAQLAKGKEMWFYACVGPSAPWPNSHLYNRLYEARVLLWQAFLYRCQGFLYWSATAYYHGGYGMAYNGWGDGWFVHQGDAGTGKWYDSPRWENYRDAQEDYEYLWLLNASIAIFRATPGLIPESEVTALETKLTSIIGQVAGEREEYCDHPAEINSARQALGDTLSSLATMIDLNALGAAAWQPQ